MTEKPKRQRKKKDPPTQALEVLEALVIHELRSDAPNRFERAEKICEQAHKLGRMFGTRVGSVVNLAEQDAAVGYNIGVAQMANPYQDTPRNHQDFMREAMSHIIPHLKEMEKKHRRDELREARRDLEVLLHMREIAERSGIADIPHIDGQIRKAKAYMEELQNELLRADVLRGSQAGDSGQEALPTAVERALAEGAGSTSEIRSIGDQEGLDGERDGGSGDPESRCVDREGGERAS